MAMDRMEREGANPMIQVVTRPDDDLLVLTPLGFTDAELAALLDRAAARLTAEAARLRGEEDA